MNLSTLSKLNLRSLFSGRVSATHGSARWANSQEIARLAKPASAPLSQGAINLAPFNNGYLELNRRTVTRHLCVFGPSGSGKSRSVFMPNLIESGNNGVSVVCTDPKGELWNVSSGYHQVAKRYAPIEPGASDECFNFIPRCSDIRIAQKLGTALASQGSTHTDRFWIEASAAFFSALFAHTATLEAPTPATALNLMTELTTKELISALSESPSRAARQMVGVFRKAGERVQGSVLIAAANSLMFLADSNVARFTSASTIGANFQELRRHPVAVYFVLPESDSARLQGLSTIFFTLLLHDLKEEQLAINYQVPVTIFLDEFANVGRLPSFSSEITVCRSRDISFALGTQSFSQIEALYGRENAQTILENCQTRIALSGLGFESAREVSQVLGKQTIATQSRSRTPQGFLHSSITINRGESDRDLLTPDEVRQIGEREMIVVTTNQRPMLLHTWFETRAKEPARTQSLGQAIEQRFESNRARSYATPPPDDELLEALPLIN
jgi:type IV secretion system protein VirD4